MAKGQKLFRGRWIKQEVNSLVKYFPTGKTREIAEELGRPFSAVRQKAYEMGLKTRQYASSIWSEEEIEVLMEQFPHRSTPELADQLNRSVKSVEGKAHRLGLAKTKQRLRAYPNNPEQRNVIMAQTK